MNADQIHAKIYAGRAKAALRLGLDVIRPRGVLVSVGMGGDISELFREVVSTGNYLIFANNYGTNRHFIGFKCL